MFESPIAEERFLRFSGQMLVVGRSNFYDQTEPKNVIVERLGGSTVIGQQAST